MAALNQLYRQLAPHGLRLLAVSVDTDRYLLIEYLNRTRFDFTVLVDAGQHWSATALRVPAFPTSYLVGRDGLILDVWIGPRDWDTPSVQAKIAALLALD